MVVLAFPLSCQFISPNSIFPSTNSPNFISFVSVCCTSSPTNNSTLIVYVSGDVKLSNIFVVSIVGSPTS